MKKCELIQSGKGMKNGLHLMEDFSSYPNMVNPPISCRVNQNQKIMLNNEEGISNNEFSIISNSILNS
jgi:hypothetical protein